MLSHGGLLFNVQLTQLVHVNIYLYSQIFWLPEIYAVKPAGVLLLKTKNIEFTFFNNVVYIHDLQISNIGLIVFSDCEIIFLFIFLNRGQSCK